MSRAAEVKTAILGALEQLPMLDGERQLAALTIIVKFHPYRSTPRRVQAYLEWDWGDHDMNDADGHRGRRRAPTGLGPGT
jgi:hypothetical protein